MDEQAPVGPATPPLRDSRAVLERIAIRLSRRYSRTFYRETVARKISQTHASPLGRAATRENSRSRTGSDSTLNMTAT